MSQAFCGIICKSSSHDGSRLPLEEVQINAFIVDVAARITLVQVFANTSNEPIPSAKYVFPVPAGAAVCGFNMRTEDGHVVTGTVKEKKQAAEEHENAKRKGRMTGLVEWATDDVFSLSLGCLPAEQNITTTLTYTISLMNDDFTDQIRFHLPMCIGERYGKPPEIMEGAATAHPLTRVRFQVYIQTQGTIHSVLSPTHPALVALPYQSENGIPSKHRMIARYESPEYLTQDFVMTIQAQGLDEPRCFAELDSNRKSVAMHLTLVPKFDLPPVAAQEYIFLIDRSGSMTGERIGMAKKTLVMLLRALPAKGTIFNIVSFGSHSTRLFSESKRYDQAALNSATEHVDGMTADYGGTEIRAALENIFGSQSQSLPTAVFVLTDGDAYDIDATIKTVSDATTKSTAKAPLRVFTLGIGSWASTAMCEGIARAGDGICLMATEPESILGKTSRLLRASRGAIMKNISIDWGMQASPDSEDDVMKITQVPSTIDSIYTGVQFVVTAIIKNGRYLVPREIVLQGYRVGQDEPVKIKIPVRRVELSSDESSVPFITTLAARRLITQLENPKYYPERTAEWKQEAITHLGEEYQLASRYTSFVAVGDIVSDNTELEDEEDQVERKYGSRLLDCEAEAEESDEDMGFYMSEAEESDDDMGFGLFDGGPPQMFSAPFPSTAPAPPAGPGDPVVELVRLQSFDGSFALSSTFEQILGGDACREGQKQKVDDSVWATILAIVYFQKHLADQPELLEGLVEKAMEFISGYSQVDANTLLEIAKPFVT